MKTSPSDHFERKIMVAGSDYFLAVGFYSTTISGKAIADDGMASLTF